MGSLRTANRKQTVRQLIEAEFMISNTASAGTVSPATKMSRHLIELTFMSWLVPGALARESRATP
jgi:hypothetical protein